MDRFDAMLAFARVVEAGSFTKAAQTLHLSRTTVTQLIQQLEARLRVKLLHRTTRRVQVTDDGAAYYERVVRLLADLDDAETSLSAASATPRGRLRVDVPSPVARLLLIPALPAFHARYPEIELHMGVSDRPVDLVEDHVDCVVRGGAITNPSLVARQAAELPMGVFAAPGYLAQAGTPRQPQDILGNHHRVVGFLGGRGSRPLPLVLSQRGERVEVQARHACAFDDGNAYLAAGLAGLGLICVPSYMAQPHLERGELVQLWADWEIAPFPLFIAYPQNRHLSAKVRAFIDWAVDVLAQPSQR